MLQAVCARRACACQAAASPHSAPGALERRLGSAATAAANLFPLWLVLAAGLALWRPALLSGLSKVPHASCVRYFKATVLNPQCEFAVGTFEAAAGASHLKQQRKVAHDKPAGACQAAAAVSSALQSCEHCPCSQWHWHHNLTCAPCAARTRSRQAWPRACWRWAPR